MENLVGGRFSCFSGYSWPPAKATSSTRVVLWLKFEQIRGVELSIPEQNAEPASLWEDTAAICAIRQRGEEAPSLDNLSRPRTVRCQSQTVTRRATLALPSGPFAQLLDLRQNVPPVYGAGCPPNEGRSLLTRCWCVRDAKIPMTVARLSKPGSASLLSGKTLSCTTFTELLLSYMVAFC